MKKWIVAPAAPPEFNAQFPEIHPVARQLLWNRGIKSADEVKDFFDPSYEKHVHDPFLFREMETACERVWQAIDKGEKVVVHGDYDADGITGSVVLLTTFRAAAKRLGKDPDLFSSYIPHREKEGYGVRKDGVDVIAARGAGLMITVDCGIGCAEEIAYAKEKGIDTIVVDHHQIPEKIPQCIILHPLVEGETYPYKKLAAVGVAFKFACGFIKYAARLGSPYEAGYEKWLMDLVAIATVTDFMPLVGENRALEKFGLMVLNKNRRPGLKKILETAGAEIGKLDTQTVGFTIGPRLNAASRMDHADVALRTLMAETDEEAAPLAEELNRLNKERQKYTVEIVAASRSEVKGGSGKKIHLIKGEGWSAGIVGLVAGKIANETGVPTFVFGQEGERIVGSGRSIPEFNVVVAMERAKEHLARFGGHPQACGLTILGEENYAAFCKNIEAYAEEVLAKADLRPAVQVDAELSASQATWDLLEWLNKFEPHGEGNPSPKFLMSDLLVSSVDNLGKTGTHARVSVRGDLPRELKCIGFGFAETMKQFPPGSRIDAVVEVGINEWMGRKSIQVKLLDVRATEKVLA